jgi:hypothetical protein
VAAIVHHPFAIQLQSIEGVAAIKVSVAFCRSGLVSDLLCNPHYLDINRTNGSLV